MDPEDRRLSDPGPILHPRDAAEIAEVFDGDGLLGPREPERYRVSLTYALLLWHATVRGTKTHDYCPPLGAFGFTSGQALRRATAKADRRFTRRREVYLDQTED